MALIFRCLMFCGIGALAARDLRVYRGNVDSLNEFPYAVMLQFRKGSYYYRSCSGSHIGGNWVLTAAHCIYNLQPRTFVVRYGDFTKPHNESKLYSNVIKMYGHPNYNRNLRVNDIGLILVDEMPNKAQVKLLALDYKTLYGLPVKYAGFGHPYKGVHLNFDNTVLVNYMHTLPLQVGEAVVVPCQRLKKNPSDNSVLCVAPKCSNNKQESRPGDSGGPLAYNGRVIGVCRSGRGLVPVPAYTAVSPYLDWIYNTIKSRDGNGIKRRLSKRIQ